MREDSRTGAPGENRFRQVQVLRRQAYPSFASISWKRDHPLIGKEMEAETRFKICSNHSDSDED